jgi:mono/diheme cytochrome c family protein
LKRLLRQSRHPFTLGVVASLLGLSRLAGADAPTPPAAVDFARDVRPVLADGCFSCHGPEKQRGGLRLDRKSDAARGGDSGVVIVPGKSAESLLLRKVTSADPAERMPPKGDPLTAEQVDRLRRWIDSGAAWPEAATHEVHWSLQPVVRPTLPTVAKTDWSRNSIDRFILARLERAGLQPSPEADRRTLIRRATFDLTGLPPTPDEVAAFVADDSRDAYERLVDRLLAAPAYGERWARHWLDAVRFAESDGFETNMHRPRAWPYRDYVIGALNDDKPYDRFMAEQLAGDALGADMATGFLVAGAYDQVKSPDIVLTAQQRADELHDMVGTTASTFLGLTVGCARCHNHKFDPISQTDYYAMTAIFTGVKHGERPVERPDEAKQRLARLAALRDELARIDRDIDDAEPLAQPGKHDVQRRPVNARRNVERFAPVAAKFIRFTVLATTGAEPCIDELEVFAAGLERRNVAPGARPTASGTYVGSDLHKLEHINDGHYGNGRSWISNENGRGWVQLELPAPIVIDQIVWGRDREQSFKDRLATRYRIEVAIEPEAWTLVASSDDRERFGTKANRASATDQLAARRSGLERQLREISQPVSAYLGAFTAPGPTYRLSRGDPLQKREPVAPGGLAEIGPRLQLPADASDQDRRLALGRWLTDPAHPLPARVMVNRLWHYHFGRGLVDTPSDFGRNGGHPTHPELLDWVAAEFVDRGWSLKQVHRLIVLSATYRQSAAPSEKGLATDAQARLLWRYPPRRLEAEAIRDSILQVSGAIDRRMGGSGFDLFEPNENYVHVYTPKKAFGPVEWRRMVYQSRPRMQPDDTFGAFDCPEGGQIAPARTRSMTPLQALNLLNSPFLLQQSAMFADRLRRESGNDVDAQVRRGFLLAFGREPTIEEGAAAVQLSRDHGLAAFCRAVLNANEFLFVD